MMSGQREDRITVGKTNRENRGSQRMAVIAKMAKNCKKIDFVVLQVSFLVERLGKSICQAF